MSTIQVNGQTIEVQNGELLLGALRRVGVDVPTLCNMPGLKPTGACRICVVEDKKSGRLVPSCAMPVTDGMEIETHSADAVIARKTIVELLLADHPDDCNYCERNGSCELQDLSADLGIRHRRFGRLEKHTPVDISNPSIVRDPDKCILCGRCVRMCEEIQSVGAIDFLGRGSETVVSTAFDLGLNVSSCVNCGQCTVVCPTGALAERRERELVTEALLDPTKFVVVNHAPSISVSLAEEFGEEPGKDIDGQMVAALRQLGFDRVFDTSFAADLTVMEEAGELVDRITNGDPLPMFTSCSPAWIKFAEQFYPELLPNLSSCKSPQQMMGAVLKGFFAKKEGRDPANVINVAIMPCTAKKFEAKRPEMIVDTRPDVDHVLTTRELAQIIKQHGLKLGSLKPEVPDSPFGERSSAGKLFGASGGVMEAALRTAHFLVTGEEVTTRPSYSKVLRENTNIREFKVKVGDLELGCAVVSGLASARLLMDEVKAGRKPDLHFVEVMSCPGGCVAGGGQPYHSKGIYTVQRRSALYGIDKQGTLKNAHNNPSIKALYEQFLEEPGSEVSHRYLHTHYEKRDVLG